MYAASSRSLIVKKPWGLSSVRMLARMAVLNDSCHTYHPPKGLQKTLIIGTREASVSPIHVGWVGLISIRCVGLAVREEMR